jgi:hypothetical protein
METTGRHVDACNGSLLLSTTVYRIRMRHSASHTYLLCLINGRRKVRRSSRRCQISRTFDVHVAAKQMLAKGRPAAGNPLPVQRPRSVHGRSPPRLRRCSPGRRSAGRVEPHIRTTDYPESARLRQLSCFILPTPLWHQ